MKLQQWRRYLPQLIDTHCHLTHYQESHDVIAEIRDLQVNAHCMSISPNEFLKIRRISGGNIRTALGYFPLEVEKDDVDQRNLFFEHLKDETLIGEVGLDYTSECPSKKSLQKQFFTDVVDECNRLEGRTLSIHSRRAINDVLEILEDKSNVRSILHWFSGSEESFNRACSMPQIYFSINTAMTSTRRLRPLLERLPEDRILLETDGPYIQINKRAAVPADIRLTVEGISRIKKKSTEHLIEQIYQNQKNAFNGIL